MGALAYLDQNEYISNMEVISFTPGLTASGGEPLTTMWARGKERAIPGAGGFVSITDPRKPFAMGQGTLNGGLVSVAYQTSTRKWLAITAAASPLTAPDAQYPRGKYDPADAAVSTSFKGLRGIRCYEVKDPAKPDLLQEFSTGEHGGGTHMNFYDGGKYMYLDCGFDDQLRQESSERPFSNALMIVDMTDPARIQEVSRWWVPGQRLGEEEAYKKYPSAGDQSSWTGIHGAPAVPRRIEDGGKLGYSGWGAFGFLVHDFSDIRRPKLLSQYRFQLENFGGIPYHTVYPLIADSAHPQLNGMMVAVFEALEADCREPFHTSYVMDVRDPRKPKIVGLFPRPHPDPKAPYADFCQARGRFSSHNMQSWLAPGAMRPELVTLAYFNAGLRCYNIGNPADPREIAYFVPKRDGDINQFNTWRRGTSESVFIEWDRNLIWLTTHAGLYCLSTPALGKPVLEPRKVERWSVPHCNVGWDDATPATVYLGGSRRSGAA